MKKKKYILILAFASLLFFCLSVKVYGNSEKYKIGENAICYVVDGIDKEFPTLVIEGTGDTFDYKHDYDITGRYPQKPDILKPNMWKHYNLYVSDGITSIGDKLLSGVAIERVEHLSQNLVSIKSFNIRGLSYKLAYEDLPRSLEFVDVTNLHDDIVFPNKVDALPFKCINQRFYTGDNITSIKISNKTNEIGFLAFEKLRNLQYCEIPPSVTFIADNAFGTYKNCTIKGYSGSYAESYANQHQMGFESIGIMPKPPVVGEIYEVGLLKYYLRPDNTVVVMGVTNKGKKAKTITIPKEIRLPNSNLKYKVEYINKKAFQKHKYLTRVNIGSNIKYIGENAFYGCKNLKIAKIISLRLSSVHKKAFYSNRNLKIYFPESKYNKYKKIILKSGVYDKVKFIKFK